MGDWQGLKDALEKIGDGPGLDAQVIDALEKRGGGAYDFGIGSCETVYSRKSVYRIWGDGDTCRGEIVVSDDGISATRHLVSPEEAAAIALGEAPASGDDAIVGTGWRETLRRIASADGTPVALGDLVDTKWGPGRVTAIDLRYNDGWIYALLFVKASADGRQLRVEPHEVRHARADAEGVRGMLREMLRQAGSEPIDDLVDSYAGMLRLAATP